MTVRQIEPNSFQAVWTEENKKLVDTSTISKICQAVSYPLRRIGMMLLLPSTFIFNKRTVNASIRELNASWRGSEYKINPVTITSPDQKTLRGHFAQRADLPANAPLIICFEPNASLSSSASGAWLLEYANLESLPYNFLFVDYRGVGQSEGNPTSTQQILLDADSVLQFAQTHLKVSPEKIGFYGHSFGGAVVACLKQMHPECTGPAVLDRTFSSLPAILDSFQGLLGWIGKKLLPHIGWNMLEAGKAIPQLKGRTLITCHPQDRVIPQKASPAIIDYSHLSEVEKMQIGNEGWDFWDERKKRDHSVNVPNAHGKPLYRFETDQGALALHKTAQFLFSPSKGPDELWIKRFSESSYKGGFIHPEKSQVYQAVAKLFQNGGLYFGSGEDAFHNRRGLSLTNAQKAQAIREAWYEQELLSQRIKPIRQGFSAEEIGMDDRCTTRAAVSALRLIEKVETGIRWVIKGWHSITNAGTAPSKKASRS